MIYRMSRPRLLAFVVACVVWLLAFGMGQADDPARDIEPAVEGGVTVATAPDASAVPAQIEQGFGVE